MRPCSGTPGRRLLLAAVLALLPILLIPGPAETAPPTSVSPGAIPFGPGEEFNFAVKFGFVRAGNATMAVETMEVVKGEATYRIVSTARSARFFATFFPVEDRVISRWSPRLRLPLEFEKHIREGKYAKDVCMRFDHDRGMAVYADSVESEILPGSQDVLSAFYFVRSLPLAVGMVIEVPNHSDGKNYPLQVRVIGRETVEVPAGKFSCWVVEPLLKSAGLFKQEGRLTIWLTDDARRMPVLMKSKVAVGSIVAELESFRMGRPISIRAPVSAPRPGAAAASRTP
jgi:hypothetical protein